MFIDPVSAPRVYWDLDIQTNAVIKYRGLSEVLPPHPEVELLRSQLILKLRQHYRELCQQREGSCLLALSPFGFQPFLARAGASAHGLGDGSEEFSGANHVLRSESDLLESWLHKPLTVTLGSLLNPFAL